MRQAEAVLARKRMQQLMHEDPGTHVRTHAKAHLNDADLGAAKAVDWPRRDQRVCDAPPPDDTPGGAADDDSLRVVA